MITVEMTKPLGAMLFDSAFPRNDFETGVQKKNADGVPMWSIAVIVKQPDARRSETLTVNVPLQQDPNDVFETFDRVAFEGMRLMTGSNNDGNLWVSFGADKIGKPSAAAPKAESK